MATAYGGNAPIELAPPEEQQLPPAADTEMETPAPAEPPGAIVDTSILEEIDLTAPSPLEYIGLQHGNAPPWDENLWQGADPLFLLSLLNNSPIRPATTAVGILETRLLLQFARTPKIKPSAFLKLRLERLFAMGKLEEAEALLDMAVEDLEGQGEPLPPTLLQNKARIAISRYDLPTACEVSEQTGKSATEPFFLKLGIVCSVLAGEDEAAALSLAVFLERFGKEITAANYITLVSALLGQGEKPQRAEPTTDIIELALIKLLEIPPGDSPSRNGVICRMLFFNPNQPEAARFKNGLCAVATGAMKIKNLALLIDASPGPTRKELVKSDPSTPEGRLKILRSMGIDKLPPAAKLKAAADMLERVESPLNAPVFLRLLEKRLPARTYKGADGKRFARLMARLYYLVGEAEMARRYGDHESLAHWRYLSGQSPDDEEVGDWMRRLLVTSENAAETLYRLRMFYAAAEVLGKSPGPQNWWPVLAEAQRGLVIEGAGIEENRGDVVLWLAPEKSESFAVRLLSSLTLVSRSFPSGVSPLAIGHAAHYWREWGLEKEAQLLLYQAMFAAGL